MYILESGSSDGNAHNLPFLTLTGDGVLTLPPVDDDSFPITLPQPLPLGTAENVTTYTTVYVSVSIYHLCYNVPVQGQKGFCHYLCKNVVETL